MSPPRLGVMSQNPQGLLGKPGTAIMVCGVLIVLLSMVLTAGLFAAGDIWLAALSFLVSLCGLGMFISVFAARWKARKGR